MQMSDIPRSYNAADDLVGRNLKAGRGGKLACIDDAGNAGVNCHNPRHIQHRPGDVPEVQRNRDLQ